MSKDLTAGTEAVKSYMTSHNRPFSTNDVFSNLHKEYGKTVVAKALDALETEHIIRSKLISKQKIYWADQSQFQNPVDSELKAIDDDITMKNNQVKLLQGKCRSMESELKVLVKSLPTDELKATILEIENANTNDEQKLKSIEQGGQTLATKDEKEKITTEHERCVKEWRKRKRMANDILGEILENYPKKKKDLYNEMGIETDEDYNVALPSQ